MEISFNSLATTAERVRQVAINNQFDNARQYACWSLETDDIEVEKYSLARYLAWRSWTRGALVPPAPQLEQILLERFKERAAIAASYIHQIQLVSLSCCSTGLASRIDGDLSRLGFFDSHEAAFIYALALEDLKQALDDFSLIYPEKSKSEEEAVFISWTGVSKSGMRNIFISNGLGPNAKNHIPQHELADYQHDHQALSRLAKRFFLISSLREEQSEAIAPLLKGKDLVLELPTGAGKSLVFQLAALLCPGTALIFAPLRALARDQERRLAALGIDKVGLLVGDDTEITKQSLNNLSSGELIAAFAAPERLDQNRFRQALRNAAERVSISFVVIDEAQCAARRSQDWRPSYRQFASRIREWTSSLGSIVPIAALSGTATMGAFAEAMHVLDLRSATYVRNRSVKDNLQFRVNVQSKPDHFERLKTLLSQIIPAHALYPGIIFCPRVEGPLGAATIARQLYDHFNRPVPFYTGRAPHELDSKQWQDIKNYVAREFLNAKNNLICATRAFGLGIDRSDIRFCVHIGFASSLEEFYQQVGRVGRDGLPAFSYIIVEVLSLARALRWAQLPLEDLRLEISALKHPQQDDVSRAYQQHLMSFPGIVSECHDAEIVASLLQAQENENIRTLNFNGQDEAALLKSLLYFEETGFIKIEQRTGNGWAYRIMSSWSSGVALDAAKARIKKYYECTEPSRRASLAELIELCLQPQSELALAKRRLGS